jgi:CheY-like chemotaxis protein
MPMGARTDGPTAVIVEDCEQVRYILTRLLQRGGFATRAFSSAVEALDGWQQLGSADLLVTDLTLPHMAGDQFVRYLRKHGLLGSAAVMLVTAVTSLASPVPDAVLLRKPFTLKEFEAALARVVGGAASDQEAGELISKISA